MNDREHRESIDELLSDPMIRQVMRADGVNEQEFKDLLVRIAREFDSVAFPPAPSDEQNRQYRRGVGILLLNRANEVFVGRRIGAAENAWQMPQGGIDSGETPRSAAMRELREEIGTEKAEIIAETHDWLRYEFPPQIVATGRHPGWRGQMQKWFAMRFLGEDGDININTEHPEFDQWKWVDPNRLPDLIISFKRQVYLEVLDEFRGLSWQVPHREEPH